MHDLLGLPLVASAHGGEIDQMIVVIHWMMFILFAGWGGFFLYTLIRFRQSKSPKADPVGVKSHFSSYIEGAVAIFEVVLLVGFAYPLWSKRVNALPPEKDATVVRVIAEQFAWNVHYPGNDGIFGRTDIKLVTSDNPIGLDRSDPNAKDDITTINQLNLPVGKPVIVRLSSKDVIHSFGIPLLRVKQDAIPGEVIRVWFEPTMTNDQVLQAFTKWHHVTLADTGNIELQALVARDEYKGKDGNAILTKMQWITPDVIPQLVSAGITEIAVAPPTPIEIACAQLCGLGHYRMRGFVNIQTPEEYKAWLAEETALVQQEQQQQQAADSTTTTQQ